MEYLKEKILKLFKKDENSKIKEYNKNGFLDSFSVLKKSFIDINSQNYLSYFFTILIMFIMYSLLSGFTSDYLINNTQNLNPNNMNSLQHNNSILLFLFQLLFGMLFSFILFIIPNSIHFFNNKLNNVQKIKKSTNILYFLPHIFLSFIISISFLYFLILIFNINLTIEELQAMQNSTNDIEANKNAFYALSLFFFFIPFVIYFMYLGYLNNRYLENNFFRSYWLTIKALFGNLSYVIGNMLIFVLLFILYLIISVFFAELNENLKFIFNVFSVSFFGLLVKNVYTSLFIIQIDIIQNDRVEEIKNKIKNNKK